MRRPVRTLAGVTAAAFVAVACSFTSSGAGGSGAEPDLYEGGLLPDGAFAQPSGSSGSSSGSPSNAPTSGGSSGVPSVGTDI
jgi:hypothetical protein